MPSLLSNGTILCEVNNLNFTEGKRNIVRAGSEIVPGKKEPDVVTFTCSEPMLQEATYQIRLDDDKMINITIENWVGTQTGCSVRALVQQ